VPAPACPRCAYDLSGAVATWDASCPLTGTCSECGLGFSWPDIFHISAASPWYIEDGRASPRRFLLTSLAAFRPRLLWRECNRRLESRLHRVALLALLWAIALHASVYLLAITRGHNYTTTPPRFAESAPLWLWPYKATYEFPVAGRPSTFYEETISPSIIIAAGFWLSSAAWILLLVRIRRPRIAMATMLRATFLSASLVFVAFWLQAAVMLAVTYLNAQNIPIPDPVMFIAFYASLAAWPIILCLWWQQALELHAHHPRASRLALYEFLLSILTTIAAIVIAES
jgi:hypothetical protein